VEIQPQLVVTSGKQTNKQTNVTNVEYTASDVTVDVYEITTDL